MTIDTLIKSKDLYVLFDGCPTCHPGNSKYLEECRTQAQKTRRKLHIVPSGSPTATLMRTIAKNQGQHIEYPMILIDGTIRHEPQDTTTTERTTK
ncbi:MAG: Thioredoxin domain protein [Namikivirus ozawa]|uniref:Thioredoxin domain protein n=1 Tax=Bacteriophage sp. TaxID=38018 RepID=A0ABY5TT07_9VIRU|nr:MAG: Thioredoxin domain protein [Bacteriophage sp.]